MSLIKTVYIPLGLTYTSKKSQPFSETLVSKEWHEAKGRHTPVSWLKLKQLHSLPQRTLQIRIESVVLFNNGSLMNLSLSNSSLT